MEEWEFLGGGGWCCQGSSLVGLVLEWIRESGGRLTKCNSSSLQNMASASREEHVDGILQL